MATKACKLQIGTACIMMFRRCLTVVSEMRFVRDLALLTVALLLLTVGAVRGQVAAYVQNSTVKVKDGEGTVTDTQVSGVKFVGRVSDLDDDGTLEIPAINNDNNLLLIEKNGSTETLVTGEATVQSSLGVGDVNNDGEPEILFQNQADNDYIYRVELDGTTAKIRPEDPIPTGGPVGYGDFTGDGDKDIVFTGTSQELKYLDDGTVTSTGVGIDGVGPLADFDFDGVPRVAYVGGSGNIKLLNDQGGKTTLATDVGAKKNFIGASDRRGDYELEIIFQGNDEKLYTMTLAGNTQSLTSSATNNNVGASGDHNTIELGVVGTAGNEGDPSDPSSLGGDAGWRLIGPPVQNVAPEDLESKSDPAGSVIEFDLPTGDDMFFEWDDGAGQWTAVTDSASSSSFVNGRAYLLFLFDDEGTPDADPLDPTLSFHARRGNAIVPTADVQVDNLDADASFHFLANAYNKPFNLTHLEDPDGNAISSGASGFKTVVQIWDGGDTSGEDQATQGSYLVFDTANNQGQMIDDGSTDGSVVSAWQGFCVERDGSSETTLTFKSGGRTSGDRDIVGSKTSAAGPDPVRIGLKLAVEEGGEQIARDVASALSFHPEATAGPDAYDASKLTPLTYPYAVLGPVGPIAGGDTSIKAQESRPLDQELPLEVPLRLKTEGEMTGTATIQGHQWQGVPEDWTVTLIDTKGTADPSDDVEHELTGSGSDGYEFTIGGEAPKNVAGTISTDPPSRGGGDSGDLPEQLSLSEAVPQKTSPSDSTRFQIRVDGSSLPVELAAFDATLTDQAAHLQWRTASETDNAGFQVQHRPPGTDAFQPLGFVESKAPGGTSTTARQYRYETETLPAGQHGFRLRQVDTDGSASLSDPVAVQVGLGSAVQVGVAPNPVRTEATLTLRVRSEQDVTARLYDVLGRQVRTLHHGPLAPQRRHAFPLQAEGLSSGLYLLQVEGEQFQETRRVPIVQ